MDLLTHHHRPRTVPYIGDSDEAVLAFISNLARRMEDTGPEAYGLASHDAAIIIAARDRYAPLFQACGTNDRTTTRVCAKDQARDEADRISRRYAQIIKRMPQDRVSDELKVMAGVPIAAPHARREVRIAGSNDSGGLEARAALAIESFPRLAVDVRRQLAVPPQVKVRFKDSSLSTSRMPREFGVTHMILHAEITPGEAGQNHVGVTGLPSAMRVVGYVTRNPHTLRFDERLLARFGWRMRSGEGSQAPRLPRAVLPCLSVMLRGQWLNAKGEVGPLGPAAMFNVPVPYLNAQATAEPKAEAHNQQSLKQAA